MAKAMRRILVGMLMTVQGLGLGAGSAAAIELVPNTVNMFRDARGLNDVVGTVGDNFQFGADIQGGSAGASLTARYLPTGVVNGPGVCAPLAVNPNQCARAMAFNAGRIEVPWSFTFTRGSEQLTVPGPTLTDNDRSILTPASFPTSVTMKRGATPLTPVISWVVPDGFVPDAFRVNIFDRKDRLANGTANVIHSVAIDPRATSYTIPPTLSNTIGRNLAIDGQYAINFQLIETRGHVPLAGNNNALILKRSSSFFVFSPTGDTSVPEVHLPQVGIDPNPGDEFGPPYVFSIEEVGPDTVTFIDPVVAIGYDYAIGTGDPNFASVMLPLIGDGTYDVIVNGVRHAVAAGEQFFFPEGGVAAFSVRGVEASARLDPNDVTAFVTGLTFVRAGRFSGTMTPVLATVPDDLPISFEPARVWVGLKNSDAVGLRLDLRAEVFLNAATGDPIAEGEVRNVSAGGSGFNNAALHAIPVTVKDGVTYQGEALVWRVSARRTCSGGGHASGTARLWYNGRAIDTGAARDAGSHVTGVIEDRAMTWYLRPGSVLSDAAGTARTFTDVFVDSRAACTDRPFVPFGVWTKTP